MTKATDGQLKESYERLHNVWKVAAEFGMCGQSVWERLKKMGYEDQDKWTPTQIELLRKAYAVGANEPVHIRDLEKLLGRDKSNISRKAKELGLTSRTRKKSPEACQDLSVRTKEWYKNNPHPKGAYKTGKEIRTCPSCGKFFEEFPSSPQIYCSVSCSGNYPQPQGNQGYSKSGKRPDLNNQYFRSRWEANYARYLNYLISKGEPITKWEFEPETFEFKKIKRGTRFYTPDFRLTFSDGSIEYHEVKGWDYPKGRTARKRFGKYFPNLKLILIDKEWFKAINRQGIPSLIPNWENGRSSNDHGPAGR